MGHATRLTKLLLARDGGESADLAELCAASFSEERWGLRIGSIFVILVTSTFGTLLPILLRSSRFVPRSAFDFAKYFGSGVIIATAFIHLLTPAIEELGSECLTGAWQEYPWAQAIALVSVFGTFFAEVAAYRLGSERLRKLNMHYSSHVDNAADAHAHSHVPGANEAALAADAAGTAEEGRGEKALQKTASDESLTSLGPSPAEAAAQLIGVAVLEFGVVVHSVIIGLTLAVSDEFTVLFIVIIFHQMFEGLGLGSRLASLALPAQLSWARYAAALLYAICTPIGIAAGLGVRTTFNANGRGALIASGILDATSAGILLYTGLVELMAHEIILNPKMMSASTGKIAYALGCMALGAGIMALLGRWA